MIFVAGIDRNVIRWEEQALQRKFGAEFTACCQKIRRWLWKFTRVKHSLSVLFYMNDPDRFDSLLQEWQPTPSVQPDFNQRVHARIDSSTQSGLFARVLTFPATLPLAASVAIMLGASAAISVDRAQHTDQMATAYARKIDPIQMTSQGGH